jgi:hypothetical protein
MFHNLLVDLGYTVLDIDYREVMDTDVILEQEFTVLWAERFNRSN